MARQEIAVAAPTDGPRRIPAWKFTAGVMIHLYPVAYVVVLVGKVIDDGGVLLTTEAIRKDLTIAPLVMLAWAVLTVAASITAGVASSIARRRREWRQANDPSAHANLSKAALTQALEHMGRAASALDPVGVLALERIRTVAAGPWDHADLRFQRISRDLGSAARLLGPSVSSGGAEASRAMGLALATLADAAEGAARDRGRDGVEGAQVFLDYLSASYGGPSTDPLRIP